MSKGNNRETFSQSIDKAAIKKFMDLYDSIKKYADTKLIQAPSKGDLLSKILYNSEIMTIKPEDYFK